LKTSQFRWNRYTWVYACVFAFYLWMAVQIPYTHDDWDWGISNGIRQLVHATLNARYVGNFFAVVMTRSEILKTLIMGTGCFLIPYGLAAYAAQEQREQQQERKLRAFLLCNVLLFTLPREIWRQTYGWVAGFANYSVSIVFLLVWIREIGEAFSRKSADPGAGGRELLLCFAGSVLVQLFLENLAIYTVLLSLFLCGIHFARNRKIPLKSILMVLGAIVGLLIMFSSRIYGSLWSTGEAVNGYRSLSVGTQYSLMTAIYMLLSQAAVLAPLIFEENPVLCLTVLGLLTVLLLQKQQQKGFVYALCAANGLFALYVLYSYISTPAAAQLEGFPALVVNGAFFLTVTAETVIVLQGRKETLGAALTIWFSVPGVILPLVFTLETGNRLFFTSDVFFVLFAAVLLMEVAEKSCLKKITVLLLTGALLLMCFYGYIYHAIGVCKRERDGLMARAAAEKASSVTLPHYPFEDYLWAPNPVGEKRETFFRTFYRLPEDIEIHIQY